MRAPLMTATSPSLTRIAMGNEHAMRNGRSGTKTASPPNVKFAPKQRWQSLSAFRSSATPTIGAEWSLHDVGINDGADSGLLVDSTTGLMDGA